MLTIRLVFEDEQNDTLLIGVFWLTLRQCWGNQNAIHAHLAVTRVNVPAMVIALAVRACPSMNVWYSRPVFFVESVERSIAFYADKLGFTESSRYEEDGKTLVGQVSREDCEILLNCQQPEKTGRGRIFISIDLELLQTLRAEFEARGAPVKDGWWGYDTMIIEDPDGNELFFPYPNNH